MKVISFSLWGSDPKYTVGAVKNGELAKEIYPGWVCRFHIGGGVPPEITERLGDLGEIINYDGEDWRGMFWRFFDAGKYDAFISRDTDSRLGRREKAAVDEWLESGKGFHVMRDHPCHAFNILGGMWGCRENSLKDVENMVENYSDRNSYYQVDQNFLRDVVSPIAKGDVVIHDPFFSGKPFPTEREGIEFVGEVFEADDSGVEDHREVIKGALGL